MTLVCAISPCPNDIYTYAALMSGQLANDYTFKVAPIGKLNQMALRKEADVLKISAGTYPLLKDHYRITSIGASFGLESGPKLVARKNEVPLKIAGETVLTPGISTTASMVLARFFPSCQQVEAGLLDIPKDIQQGKAPLGIVLNEAVHDLDRYDLVVVMDLAELWQEKTQSLLPLGVVVVAKACSPEQEAAYIRDVKESLAWAHSHHEEALQIALRWSGEKELNIVEQHIARFAKYADDASLFNEAIRNFITAYS